MGVVPFRNICHCFDTADTCSPGRGVPRLFEKRELPHPAGGRGRLGRRDNSIRDGLPQGLDFPRGQGQELRAPLRGLVRYVALFS